MADPPNLTTEGSAIRPEYAHRSMKCFAVTESELNQLGLANLGVTITFGIGSALLAFGLDIFKDTTLGGEVSPEAQVIVDTIQPLLFIFGVVFWIAAAVLWRWRWNMLRLIKQESKS